MEIKCRGNTSALAYEKKPYKIKLPEPYDFGLDHSFKSTEWALINTEWNLNNFVGSFIGKECGLEWCPKGIFVNVILNGDWKGTYYLVQAVGIESANGIVDEDGFIVENDAYWWKEGEVSFRTDTQSPNLGFTFKYPVPSSESDPIAQRIRNHIQMVENSIINQDYQNVIDEKSFAKWILARDFMGIFDGGGANQYYYKKSMTDPGSLLKMGPLWDWENAYYPDAWSKCRLAWLSWFGFLFQYDSFQEVYRKEYEAVSRSLLDDLMKELDFLDQEYGQEIEASWRLDSSRWKHDIVSFPDEKNKALEWFHDRIPWMDRYVYYNPSSPAQELDANSFQCVNEALSIVIDMEADFDGWKDFYGIYTDDKELLSNNCVIGYMSEEGKVYLANEIEDDEDLRKNLFWSISVGIISGVGLYILVILLCVIMTLMIWVLNLIPVAKAPILLIIRTEIGADMESVNAKIKSQCSFSHQDSIMTRNNENELIYEIKTKDKIALVNSINSIPGVVSISCLEHDGEIRM